MSGRVWSILWRQSGGMVEVDFGVVVSADEVVRLGSLTMTADEWREFGAAMEALTSGRYR